MGEVTVVGVDLAENVSQLHGAASDGCVVLAGYSRASSWRSSLPVAVEPKYGSNRHYAQSLQRLTGWRRLDSRPRSSANLPKQLILRSITQAKFLVVFEGYSERAVHLEAGPGPEIGSLRPRILWTCSLRVF